MKKVLLLCFAVMACVSCATSTKSFAPSGSVVTFDPSDFEFSAVKSASATTVRILGIDWVNLFVSESGDASGAPVVSAMPLTDNTANKAAFKLLEENPNYDVVFYPKVDCKKLSYIVYSTSHATVSGRLGRLKK